MHNAKPEDILERILRSSVTGSDLNIPKELQGLAHIGHLLHSLANKPVPMATRRRLYVTQPIARQGWFLSLVSNLRLLTLSASALTLIGLLIAANSVQQSFPGGRGYPIKKAAEQLQVKYGLHQANKVTLQLALAEKRLAEAETILATTPTNPERTAAALTELANQTRTTVATLQDAADKQTIVSGSSIVSQLSNITERQLALLNSIEKTVETQPATDQALTTTKESTAQVATIIKQLLTAATKDSVLATINELPVIITGSVTQIDNNGVTIDKTRIEFTETTTVKTIKGELTQLNLYTKVSVSAINKSNVLVAQEITINAPAQADKETVKKPAPAEIPPPVEEAPEQTPATVKGGFMFEDPTSQFTP